MAEESLSDDFKSFITEFAKEAQCFGRSSLPNESTWIEADVRSSVSMETTQTNTHSPVPSSNYEEMDADTITSGHQYTYTVSSSTPSPPLKKSDRILYGPCPARAAHSHRVCEVCHLTAQEYRLERYEQARHVYSKHSINFARASKQHTPPPPPLTASMANVVERISPTVGTSSPVTSLRRSVINANKNKCAVSGIGSRVPPPTASRVSQFNFNNNNQRNKAAVADRRTSFAVSRPQSQSSKPPPNRRATMAASDARRKSLFGEAASSTSAAAATTNYVPLRRGPLPKFVDTSRMSFEQSVKLRSKQVNQESPTATLLKNLASSK